MKKSIFVFCLLVLITSALLITSGDETTILDSVSNFLRSGHGSGN